MVLAIFHEKIELVKSILQSFQKSCKPFLNSPPLTVNYLQEILSLKNEDCGFTDYKQRSYLFMAIKVGNIETIKVLVDVGGMDLMKVSFSGKIGGDK